jgi:hypothetical protein
MTHSKWNMWPKSKLHYIVFIYIYIYTYIHTYTHTKQLFVNGVWKTLYSSTLGKDYTSYQFLYNVWHSTYFILSNSVTENKSKFHISCSALPTMCWDGVLQWYYIKHKFQMNGSQIKSKPPQLETRIFWYTVMQNNFWWIMHSRKKWSKFDGFTTVSMHVKGIICNLNCDWILPQCLFLRMLEICCDFPEWWVPTDTIWVTTPVCLTILVHGQKFDNHCSELWCHIEIFIKHMKKCTSQK